MKKTSTLLLAGMIAGGASAKIDSGFYAGLGASWNVNKYKHDVTGIDNNLYFTPEIYTFKFKKNTIAPEIFLGYLCVGKSFAWAPEIHIGQNMGTANSRNVLSNPNKDNVYQTARVKKRLNVGVDLKLGKIIRDSTFVYGVLGLDMSRYKVSYKQDEIHHGQVDSTRTHSPSAKYVPGLKVGAGADFYTTQNLFVGGEVSYLFRSKSIKSSNTIVASGGAIDLSATNKVKPKNGLAVKVKVGWKF